MTTRDYRYLLRAKRGCENLELTSDTLRFLNQFMTLIEKQFGNKCETVFSVPGEEGSRRIVDIRNGHITGRAAGDEDGNLGLEVAPGTDLHTDRFNYITTVRNGRILRSSTICMEDKNGKELCSLSVNFDITETLQMEGFYHAVGDGGMNHLRMKTILWLQIRRIFRLTGHLAKSVYSFQSLAYAFHKP